MGGTSNVTGSIRRPSLVAIGLAVDDVVTTRALLEAGVTRRQIQHLVRIAFLHPRHRGVWAVGRPILSFDGSCRAAVLACGDGSATSHVSAGRLHGFRSSTGRVHVSAPRTVRGHPGIWLHRPLSLPEEDVTRVRGIPVTSVGRTLLDTAPGQPVERIAGWMHEADVQRVLDLREVRAVLERHPTHRGARRLEAALETEVAPTRSGLEDAYLAIWHSLNLPAVESNWNLWTGERWEECDFVCFERGLVVETDGGRYHRSRYRRRRDAEKMARLRAAGWVAERFPEVDIVLDPRGVGARTAHFATLGRRMERQGFGSQPGSSGRR